MPQVMFLAIRGFMSRYLYNDFKQQLKFVLPKFVLLILPVLVGSIFTPVYANDAVSLLNQMNDALHQLEYQGKLVYLKDGEASTLSIRHTLENGREKEVVALLDENGDEYVKDTVAFSLSSLPKITPQMQDIYSFDLGGMGKVAGRPCRIVLARPKDKKRYLQKYCIDLDRSVILKYTLINQQHQPVERFMFTDFEIISTQKMTGNIVFDEPSVNQPGSNSRSVMKMVNTLVGGEVGAEAGADSAVDSGAEQTSADSFPDNYSEWFFESLPAGFSVVATDTPRVLNEKGGNDEQIVISDGLSSVSVFITKDKNVTKPIKPIRSGALNIVSRIYQGYAVTLVGEVPKSTLQDIFKGMKRASISE